MREKHHKKSQSQPTNFYQTFVKDRDFTPERKQIKNFNKTFIKVEESTEYTNRLLKLHDEFLIVTKRSSKNFKQRKDIRRDKFDHYWDNFGKPDHNENSKQRKLVSFRKSLEEVDDTEKLPMKLFGNEKSSLLKNKEWNKIENYFYQDKEKPQINKLLIKNVTNICPNMTKQAKEFFSFRSCLGIDNDQILQNLIKTGLKNNTGGNEDSHDGKKLESDISVGGTDTAQGCQRGGGFQKSLVVEKVKDNTMVSSRQSRGHLKTCNRTSSKFSLNLDEKTAENQNQKQTSIRNFPEGQKVKITEESSCSLESPVIPKKTLNITRLNLLKQQEAPIRNNGKTQTGQITQSQIIENFNRKSERLDVMKNVFGTSCIMPMSVPPARVGSKFKFEGKSEHVPILANGGRANIRDVDLQTSEYSDAEDQCIGEIEQDKCDDLNIMESNRFQIQSYNQPKKLDSQFAQDQLNYPKSSFLNCQFSGFVGKMSKQNSNLVQPDIKMPGDISQRQQAQKPQPDQRSLKNLTKTFQRQKSYGTTMSEKQPNFRGSVVDLMRMVRTQNINDSLAMGGSLEKSTKDAVTNKLTNRRSGQYDLKTYTDQIKKDNQFFLKDRMMLIKDEIIKNTCNRIDRTNRGVYECRTNYEIFVNLYSEVTVKYLLDNIHQKIMSRRHILQKNDILNLFAIEKQRCLFQLNNSYFQKQTSNVQFFLLMVNGVIINNKIDLLKPFVDSKEINTRTKKKLVCFESVLDDKKKEDQSKSSVSDVSDKGGRADDGKKGNSDVKKATICGKRESKSIGVNFDEKPRDKDQDDWVGDKFIEDNKDILGLELLLKGTYKGHLNKVTRRLNKNYDANIINKDTKQKFHDNILKLLSHHVQENSVGDITTKSTVTGVVKKIDSSAMSPNMSSFRKYFDKKSGRVVCGEKFRANIDKRGIDKAKKSSFDAPQDFSNKVADGLASKDSTSKKVSQNQQIHTSNKKSVMSDRKSIKSIIFEKDNASFEEQAEELPKLPNGKITKSKMSSPLILALTQKAALGFAFDSQSVAIDADDIQRDNTGSQPQIKDSQRKPFERNLTFTERSIGTRAGCYKNSSPQKKEGLFKDNTNISFEESIHDSQVIPTEKTLHEVKLVTVNESVINKPNKRSMSDKLKPSNKTMINEIFHKNQKKNKFVNELKKHQKLGRNIHDDDAGNNTSKANKRGNSDKNVQGNLEEIKTIKNKFKVAMSEANTFQTNLNDNRAEEVINHTIRKSNSVFSEIGRMTRWTCLEPDLIKDRRQKECSYSEDILTLFICIFLLEKNQGVGVNKAYVNILSFGLEKKLRKFVESYNEDILLINA